MAIILTSCLHTHRYNRWGRKRPIPIEDTNGILTNIRRYVKKYDRIVYVANDPHSLRRNTKHIKPVFKGFAKTGIKFKERVILDDRTRAHAKELLSGADLIILSGGKILGQLEFFDEIGLADVLKDYDGLVIGISAGSMNLCETVCNFPEGKADIGQPIWVKGLGFYGEIVIPHFDGATLSYQLPCNEIDVVNDHILPLSHGKTFVAIDNDAYILIDGKNVSFHGNVYSISNGKVKMLQRI